MAKANLLQQFEGMRHAGQIGAACACELIDEMRQQDRAAGEIKTGLNAEMRMKHAEALGGMQRQDQRAAIAGLHSI